MRPYIVIVEFEQDDKHHTHIFHQVYARSRGDAINLIQGFMDLQHGSARIKKLSCSDNTKLRCYDAFRPVPQP